MCSHKVKSVKHNGVLLYPKWSQNIQKWCIMGSFHEVKVSKVSKSGSKHNGPSQGVQGASWVLLGLWKAPPSHLSLRFVFHLRRIVSVLISLLLPGDVFFICSVCIVAELFDRIGAIWGVILRIMGTLFTSVRVRGRGS